SGGSTDGEALNILSNFDLAAMTGVQALHHYLESTRLAFADRNAYIGDPAYVNVPLQQLLSPEFGRQRACLINPDLALISPVAPGVPNDPNLPAAGKRPRSSMSPTIVLKGGAPWLAVGSPGGASIITTVLQILVNRIDFGMSLPDAIAAPRASQRNSAVTQAEPAFIALPTTPGLQALGQKFAITDTSALDPTIKIAPTIGVASGL